MNTEQTIENVFTYKIKFLWRHFFDVYIYYYRGTSSFVISRLYNNYCCTVEIVQKVYWQVFKFGGQGIRPIQDTEVKISTH